MEKRRKNLMRQQQCIWIVFHSDYIRFSRPATKHEFSIRGVIGKSNLRRSLGFLPLHSSPWSAVRFWLTHLELSPSMNAIWGWEQRLMFAFTVLLVSYGNRSSIQLYIVESTSIPFKEHDSSASLYCLVSKPPPTRDAYASSFPGVLLTFAQAEKCEVIASLKPRLWLVEKRKKSFAVKLNLQQK